MVNSLDNSGQPNRFQLVLCGVVMFCSTLCAAKSSVAQEPLGTELFDQAVAEPPAFDDYESFDDVGDQSGSWLRPASEYFYSWMQDWHGGFELGLNGTAGNTDATNLAARLAATRQVGMTRQSLNAYYFFTHGGPRTNANNLYARFRNEAALASSNVNWFVDVWYQYNQFNDSFFGFNTGITQSFIDNGTTRIAPRIGFGVPDLYLGLDFEHQLNARQRIFATIDYYPDFSFSDNRLNLYAGWEVLLGDDGLNLQLVVWDFYNRTDSKSGQANDVMYLMMLGKSF